MPDSPAGAPPFKAHRAAYRELLESLWFASKTFENKGDGGLEGAKLACKAVVRFLGVRHENPELASPFMMIMKSFEDLEQGLEPPLFSRKIELRERERSSQRKHLQMLAAVSMEVLMELGTGKNDSARRVASAVQKWPAFGGQTITKTTICNWRNQMRAEKHQLNRQFRQLRDHILGQPDPRRELRRLLQKPPGVPAS